MRAWIVFASLAVLAATYGASLLLTLDREFAPRGTFGLGSLGFAALFAGLAFFTWRAER